MAFCLSRNAGPGGMFLGYVVLVLFGAVQPAVQFRLMRAPKYKANTWDAWLTSMVYLVVPVVAIMAMGGFSFW